MAPITPWLATLIEAELENVIAWKRTVKPDLDTSHEHVSRFSDDGSNFRSSVGPPLLNAESTIQLLEKPGSNARAKIPVSDGDVSVLAILSDAAWEAYDKGLEEGEDARKGDLLLCKKLTVVSTTYGPDEERVKLRIEDLELTGNFRKTIGQPTSLLQRPSIVTSRETIEELRLKQLQIDDPEEDPRIKEEPEEEYAEKLEDIEEVAENSNETLPANASEVVQNAVPTVHTHPESLEGHSADTVPTPLSQIESPATPTMTSGIQIESQLPLEAMQTQQPPQPRNPVRRTRGGYSIGREGFELTRGDNLAGPQAPTLQVRHARLSMEPPEPPKNKLLDVMSKLPGQVPRKRSPQPSAPISAQIVTEDIVTEKPMKTEKKKRRSAESSTAQNSTQPPRKRYRIPKDQKDLLDDPSSWIPSAPGHTFPHPNVPIALLKAWNAKAAGAVKSPSHSSSISMNEQSLRSKSLEEVQPVPQAMAAAIELESDSEDFDNSEDESESEPIPWSQSPVRGQTLPPDSSATHMSPCVSRPGSRDVMMSESEPMPVTIEDDTQSIVSNGRKSVSGSHDTRREMSQRKHSTVSQTSNITQNLDKTPSSIHSDRERLLNTTQPSTVPNLGLSSERVLSLPSGIHPDTMKLLSTPNATQRPAISNSQPGSQRSLNILPTSSTRSTALSASSCNPAGSYRPFDTRSEGTTLRRREPLDGWQPPVAPGTSQWVSASPNHSQPKADNFQSPIRASTQQNPTVRREALDPKDHLFTSTGTSTPPKAATGSREFEGPQYSITRRPNHNQAQETAHTQSGNEYSPSQCEFRAGNNDPANRQHPGGTQTPDSTFEIESGVPRPLPHTKGARTRFGDEHRPSQREFQAADNDVASKRYLEGTRTPNITLEIEEGAPCSLPPNKYHQDRSGFFRDAQRRQWLGLYLPKDTWIRVPASPLFSSYRERYPSDPVTGQEFSNLIEELRPKSNAIEAEHSIVPTTETHEGFQNLPAANQSLVTGQHGGQKVMDQPARSPAPHPNSDDVFAEFMNGWKSIQPGGAFAKNLVGSRPQQRRLDVFSWGFGD